MSGFDSSPSESYHICHLLSKGRPRSFSSSGETEEAWQESANGRIGPFENVRLSNHLPLCCKPPTVPLGKMTLDQLLPGELITVTVSLFDN